MSAVRFMGPPTVLAKTQIENLFYWKIDIFFKILKPFTPTPYTNTAYSMCNHRGIQVKAYDPPIPTVPIFFKSKKN